MVHAAVGSALQAQFTSRRFFAMLAMSSIAIACSSGGGGGGSGDAGGLSKLSAEQQKAFQAWLSSPIKSCEAIEVVGGGSITFSDGFPGFPTGSVSPETQSRRGQSATAKGLDLKVLAQRTNGSVWLSDASNPNSFALLSGGAIGFTDGSSTSKFEQSLTINGSNQSVKVETRSSGFDCVVKINDVEVAQISIAKSVDVALAGSNNAKFKDLDIVTSDLWRGYSGVTTLSTSALARAIDMLNREVGTATALAMNLGYSQAEAEKYFVLRGANVGAAFGLEFPALSARVAFAGNGEVVLDQDEAAQLPVSGQPKTLTFISMYRTGGVSIGGVRFAPGSNDVMSVRRQVSATLGNRNVVLRDLGVKSVASFVATPEMSDICAGDRVTGYANLYIAKLRGRSIAELPSRRIILGACEALDPEIQLRYDRSDLSLRTLNRLMRGVTRSLVRDAGLHFEFGDWSSFVAGEIRSALDLKSSSKLALSTDVPILNELDGYIVSARLTPEFPQMAPAFIDPIAGEILAVAEGSRGTSIENSLIRRSVQAAVKVGPIYLAPFSRSLQYVRTTPSSSEDSLSWIESAPPSLLQVGREALAEAQAIGFEKFQSDFELFFSLRPNERDLAVARDEMRNLKVQLANYPTLLGIKRDVVAAVYKNAKFDAQDLSITLDAAAKLVVANDDLAREFLGMVKAAVDAPELGSSRDWARSLSAANAQLIRDFLTAAMTNGYGDDAPAVVRGMVHTRPTTTDLQAYANSVALSKQFASEEVTRAAGSSSDTFYESEAKSMAKRIALEGFTTADLAALESMAQVAASEAFCGDRKTISYRLKCVGLSAFSKAPGKILSPEFQGRNVRLAAQIASWMQTLKPDFDHSTVRRTLKKALFDSDSGPWAKCTPGQFEVNSQALTKAVQAYIQVMSDFSARFRAERDVSAAVDARCP